MKIFKIFKHNLTTIIKRVKLKALIDDCKNDSNNSYNREFLNFLKKELSELKYLKWSD